MDKKIVPFSFYQNPKSLRKFIIIDIWDEGKNDRENWIVMKEVKPGPEKPIIKNSLLDFKILLEKGDLEEW